MGLLNVGYSVYGTYVRCQKWIDCLPMVSNWNMDSL